MVLLNTRAISECHGASVVELPDSHSFVVSYNGQRFTTIDKPDSDSYLVILDDNLSSKYVCPGNVMAKKLNNNFNKFT